MKRLLLGTVILLTFCLAATIVQISCTKNTNAQAPVQNTGLKQLNKILYDLPNSNNPGSTIWIVNYDGTDNQELNIALPQGLNIGGAAGLSPDGKTIFLYLKDNNYKGYIYSGELNGSNVTDLTKIMDEQNSPNSDGITIDGIY